MSAVYTYQNLYDDLNGAVHGKIAELTSAVKLINRAMRFVVGDIDLRSMKRKSTLSPNLFDDVYDYTCPTDMKGKALIDVIPQINRAEDSELRLTTEEEFDRLKTIDTMMVAFSDKDFVRKLKISYSVDDDEITISTLDSLTAGGGTWTAYGDGTNLRADKDDYVKGNGSINYDISAAGGTTAGIYNDNIDDFDLTDYIHNGSVFCWKYITSITNLTNFIIRIGSSSSNYYTKTITTANDGNSFVNGWNLLRFDLFTATEVGTVDKDNCNYVSLFMTKTAGKISETDYRFDWLVVKRGAIHELLYYSKYGWQSSTGTWIENSTATTDLLNADTEEIELVLLKAVEFASSELKEYEDWKIAQIAYKEKKQDYSIKCPSEAKLIITSYYDL